MPKGVRKHAGSDEILLATAKFLRANARAERDTKKAGQMLNAAIRLEQVVKQDLP